MGARHEQQVGNTIPDGFQSTHPRWVRVGEFLESFERVVSIHAPAMGASDLCVQIGCHLEVSIHAPAMGASQSLMTTSG